MFRDFVLFLIITTSPFFLLYLSNTAQDNDVSIVRLWDNKVGNYAAWSYIVVSIIWAVVWLKTPCKKAYGPVTVYNETPEFPDNGFSYYVASVVVFLVCQFLWPQLSSHLFWNMPYFIGALNIGSLIFNVYLYFRGLNSREHTADREGKSVVARFYNGVVVHEWIFGIEVKHLAICRLGLLFWQQLILAFFIYSLQRSGFNSAIFVNVIIQTVYLAKVNYLEEEYLWSLDMMYDGTGYYLVYGAMVFVPALYTYSTYYMVLHPSTVSNSYLVAVVVVALFSVAMNARVDYEKLMFKKHSSDKEFKLWGKKVEYLNVSYKDANGKTHESKLLVSGCWGVARHLNYLFEIIYNLTIVLPAQGLGLHPYLCFIFLVVLVVHRCYRDEERCLRKYGDGYKKYCKRVPYRILPYVF